MLAQVDTLTRTETDYSIALVKLEQCVFKALQTYSNVERGSGHFSQVTTVLYEKAKMIFLDHMQLNKTEYVVIFCTPRWSEILMTELSSSDYYILSSHDIGLPLGLTSLAVKRSTLPKGVPSQTGGGMVKLVSQNSLVLADMPERFEAGTPSIMNVITFANALQLIAAYGTNPFQYYNGPTEKVNLDSIMCHDNFIEYSGRQLLIELRKTIIGHDICVPVLEGKRPYTNLDNAASTPAFLPVWEVVCQTWRQPKHVQQHIVSMVKEICAKFLDAPLDNYELIFCSNTTEAINIAAQNLEHDIGKDTEPVILNTFLEHHSNELPWRYSPKASLIRLDVDDEGFLNLDDLECLLKEYNLDCIHGKKRIRIVAVSGASNVLGSYNDIRAIARITHKYNAQILVDGAQLVAHRAVSMIENDIDYLAFSGHKMYAPFGSGALIVRKELLNFKPDELAKIKASGEENIIGIAAIGKAMILLQRIGMNIVQDEENRLVRYMLQGLSKIQGVKVFGIQSPASAQFLNKGGIFVFSLKHISHNLVAKELAELGGIGVRNGCFCAHLITKQLMGISHFRGFAAEVFLKLIPSINTSTLPGIVRVSLGLENDEHDVDHFIKTLRKIAAQPRSLANKFIASTHNGTLFLPYTTMQKRMYAFTEAVIGEVYSRTASLSNGKDTYSPFKSSL